MPPITAVAADALSSVRREKLIWFSPWDIVVLARRYLYGPDAAGSSAIWRRPYCSVGAGRQYRLASARQRRLRQRSSLRTALHPEFVRCRTGWILTSFPTRLTQVFDLIRDINV